MLLLLGNNDNNNNNNNNIKSVVPKSIRPHELKSEVIKAINLSLFSDCKGRYIKEFKSDFHSRNFK